MSAGGLLFKLVRALGWALGGAAMAACVMAAENTFLIGGVPFNLSPATNDLAVFYQFMRYNRAIEVWNVDIVVSNQSAQTLYGPLALRVDGFAGTTGPRNTDGTDSSSVPFYDLSATLANGALAPGQTSLPRTITLGYIADLAPSLEARVFKKPQAKGVALGFTRTLNGVGQPLPDVEVLEVGTAGIDRSDPVFGTITLRGSIGEHVWKFSAPGFLPVWRRYAISPQAVAMVPSPRLVERGFETFSLTPIGGGQCTNADRSLQITFPPGAFAQDATGRLTPLTAQTLPGFLPPGWSPLQAFWLELSGPPVGAGTATLRPWGALRAGEPVAWVKWNEALAQWDALQILSGSGTNVLIAAIEGSGAWALAVADSGEQAPPPPAVGQALAPSPTPIPDTAFLSATGVVDPLSSPASRVAELVTGSAALTVSNRAGSLSSGLILRGEVSETYRLLDGTRRVTPGYEASLVGYQRPGLTLAPTTLHATFPMRPLLLFGAQELDTATIQVDILPPAPFAGGVLDEQGGMVVGDGLKLLAGPGDVSGIQAVAIRALVPSTFADLATNGVSVFRAFQIFAGGTVPGRKLTLQGDGLATNRWFVLAKVISEPGFVGLEPRERLISDAHGVLSSLEPSAPPKLTGIDGAGQYVLAQVDSPRGLVTGLVRTSAGQPAGGWPVRMLGTPWLTLSDPTGAYRLISSTGVVQVVVRDLRTGDTGQTGVAVTQVETPSVADLAPIASGPMVLSVAPTNSATGVPRVTSIVVNFSAPINPGSVGTAGLQLFGAGDTLVSAALSLNLKNTTATLLPTDSLAPSTLHVLKLSTNMVDLNGRPLGGTLAFTFTTEIDALNRTGGQLITYEPVNGSVRIEGGPGIADPNSPAILVNETTGRTATVLSNPDGSITNSITAEVDDVLSAVFVNQNGTRTTVPASRQIFQDGSVALFHGGGILEAQGDGGGAKLVLEPGTIDTKTRFRWESVPMETVLNLVSNTLPSGASLLGSARLSVAGDPERQRAEVVFPVSPDALHLPPEVRPEDANYVLTIPTKVDGVLGYQVIDKMEYEHGSLVTHSAPHSGAAWALLQAGWDAAHVQGVVPFPPPPFVTAVGALEYVAQSAAFDALLFPLQLSAGQAYTIHGFVKEGDRPLSGAVVALKDTERFDPNQPPRPGRLETGEYYAITDRTGRYALRVGLRISSGFLLYASHPTFPLKRRVVPVPNFSGRASEQQDIVFPQDASTNDMAAPEISIGRNPAYPAAGTNATIRVLAIDGQSQPTISLTMGRPLEPLQPGVNLSNVTVTIQRGTNENVGAHGLSTTFTVGYATNVPAVMTLLAQATDDSGNLAQSLYAVPFGVTAPGVLSTNVPDPQDHQGPHVVEAWPSQGSVGVGPGTLLRLRFNEPIATNVLENLELIQMVPDAGKPSLSLSSDHQELSVGYPSFRPATNYTLTLSSGITDLSGNLLDQDLTQAGDQSFTLQFKTAPAPVGPLSGLDYGGGVVRKGIYAYALERKGAIQGGLFVYDVSKPTGPVKVAELNLPSYPRDIVLIPSYSFKRRSDQVEAETRDLLAVAGGTVGGQTDEFTQQTSGGQFLWIIDVSDPSQPKRLASALLTLSATTAVTKLAWSAPALGYLEVGADLSSVGVIDLQTMILNEFLRPEERGLLPVFGSLGSDANADGDYVDAGDELPLPPRIPGQFSGKVLGLAVKETDQPILDFTLTQGGDFVGAVFGPGHTLDTNGVQTTVALPASYRTLWARGVVYAFHDGTNYNFTPAEFRFTNGRPFRVSAAFHQALVISNELSTLDLALVAIKPADGLARLVVLDVTIPDHVHVINEIVIPGEPGDTPYSIVLGDDGLVQLAMSQDLVLLDPSRFNLPPPAEVSGRLHPAIVGAIRNAGSGARAFSSSRDGLTLVNLGGKHQLVQSPPSLSFVQFEDRPPFEPTSWSGLDDDSLRQNLDTMRLVNSLSPARHRSRAGVASSLSPPSSLVHYYVLLYAPGSAGPTLELSLESLNRAGYPLKNKGLLFPPVRAMGNDALLRMGQTNAPGCEAPIRSLKAWRLSGDKQSSFYNCYLSRPFALTYEEMSIDDLSALQAELDREILWSAFYLRAGLDPSVQTNEVVGAFAPQFEPVEKVFLPGASVLAEALPADYIMGPNPQPTVGTVGVPGSLGAISAHNGEMSLETVDLALPGRRLPVSFERIIGGQGLFEGAFGRGWDFNYNQRLVELPEHTFPPGAQMPLLVQATPAQSEIAHSGDVLFYNGSGRILLFRDAGPGPPPEYKNDPLVIDLGWLSKASRFYLPPKGVFDLLVRFPEGQFARLEPDGTQHWYTSQGRLEKIYDRYPKNELKFAYNRRGELVQIKDELDRPLDIGYWRLQGDSEFRSQIDDTTTNPTMAGKICRLKDYSDRDVRFYYSDDGLLERREGPNVTVASPGGFVGRQVTRYLWGDCSNPSKSAKGLVGVLAGSTNGTPLLAATQVGTSGRDVVSQADGAVGPVGIQLQQTNKSEIVSALGAKTTVTAADGAIADFDFNTNGLPQAIKLSGTNAAPHSFAYEYNDDGLVTKITYPEGNSIEYTYDSTNQTLRSRGNLLMVTKNPGPRPGDPLVASHRYNGKYNLLLGVQTNFNGYSITVSLGNNDRDLDTVRFANADTETFSHDPDTGQLLQHKTADGVVWDFAYDGNTGFKLAESRGGLTNRFGYSGNAGKRGHATDVTDPRGKVTTYTYDERDQVVQAVRANVYSEKWSYDESGRVIKHAMSIDEGQELVRRQQFNQVGFLEQLTVEKIDADGRVQDLVTSFEPDAVYRIKKITFPGGESRDYTKRDHLGQVLSMVEGEFQEDYAYDANGNMISISHGQAIEKYDYDGHDRVVTNTSPENGVTKRSYFGGDQPKSTSITDPVLGEIHRSTIDIDALGRASRITTDSDTGTDVLSYTYDSSTRTVSVTDSRNKVVTKNYDTAGLVVQEDMPAQRLTFKRDGNGNVRQIVSLESSRSYTNQFVYNDLDYVKAQTDDLGQILALTPRLDGAVVARTDGRSNTINQTFTLLGELTSRTQATGMQFQYRYNKNRLISLTADGTGNGRSFSYDASQALADTAFRDGTHAVNSRFDPNRRPQLVNLPGGGTITMSYDKEGRLTARTVTTAEGTVGETFTYDCMDRLTAASYPGGSVDYAYDKLGPLRRATYVENGLTLTVRTELYSTGTRHVLHYPSGLALTEERDTTDRLLSLTPSAGPVVFAQTTFATAASVGTRVLGEGAISLNNRYDQRKRLTSRKYTRVGDQRLLSEWRYVYDGADNLVARQFIERGGRADFYRYDSGDRLVRADVGVRPSMASSAPRSLAGFAPPPEAGSSWAGGFFARTYGFNNLDLPTGTQDINPDALPLPAFAGRYEQPDDLLHLGAIDGFARSRDARGNTTRAELWVRWPGAAGPSKVPATLTYDGLSRLIKVARDDGVVIENKYQQSGLRFYRKVEGPSTRCVPSETGFVYDRSRLIEEYDLAGNGQLKARYYYGDDTDEPIAADLRDAQGNLARFYVLTDLQHSVLAVTDQDGVVLERMDYDPWGQPTIKSADTAAPRLARAVSAGGGLLLEFTERVLPVFAGALPSDGLLTSLSDVSSALKVLTNGVEVAGAVTYVESVAGFAFGTVWRFQPNQALAGLISVSVTAEQLTDEWGNLNPAETLNLVYDATEGAVLYRGGAAGGSGSLPLARSELGWPLLFHGQYFDYDAGLFYMRARFYDPSTGLFLQQDPEGYGDSVHLYAGFGNNPVVNRDPSGTSFVRAKPGGGARLLSSDVRVRPPPSHATAPGARPGGGTVQKGLRQSAQNNRPSPTTAAIDKVAPSTKNVVKKGDRDLSPLEVEKLRAKLGKELAAGIPKEIEALSKNARSLAREGRDATFILDDDLETMINVFDVRLMVSGDAVVLFRKGGIMSQIQHAGFGSMVTKAYEQEAAKLAKMLGKTRVISVLENFENKAWGEKMMKAGYKRYDEDLFHKKTGYRWEKPTPGSTVYEGVYLKSIIP